MGFIRDVRSSKLISKQRQASDEAQLAPVLGPFFLSEAITVDCPDMLQGTNTAER
jgi:hypothetical protein